MLNTRVVALTLPLLLLTGRLLAAEEAEAARAVIDRAITATGGETRLARLKAAEWTCKGTAHASIELAFTDHCFAQWPEQFHHEWAIEARGEKFARVLILDGDRGWIKQDGGKMDMNASARDELRDKLYVLRVASTLLPLKETGVKLEPLAETKIDGRAVLGVSATREGHPDLNLYFDKDKGRLIECRRTVKDPMMGEVKEETSFSDYREVDGVQVAHAVSVKRGGNLSSIGRSRISMCVRSWIANCSSLRKGVSMRLLPFSALAVLLTAWPARADDAADAKALIDKAIQAVGGEAKIAQVKTFSQKVSGTFSGPAGSVTFTAERIVHLPDELRRDRSGCSR